MSLIASLDYITGFLKVTSNRDKAFKVIQYYLKFLILRQKQSKQTDGLKAFQNIASALSISRLIYRIGDWISPIKDLKTENFGFLSLEYFEAWLSIINAIFDDLITLDRCSKGEFPGFSEHTTNFLELWSTKLWLSTSLINLYLLLQRINTSDIVQRIQKEDKLQEQLLTVTKLCCDVIFCLYDIYNFEQFKEAPILAGMIAALIGIYKDVRKYRKLE